MKNDNLINKTADFIDDITNKIGEIESDCLKRIFWRYLVKKAILADIKTVERKDFENKPNYWEYWHSKYFLMSRELIVEPNINLIINYNPELVINNEL